MTDIAQSLALIGDDWEYADDCHNQSVASKKRRIGTLFDDEEYYHCKPFVSDTYFLPPFVVPDDHPSRLSARERNLSPGPRTSVQHPSKPYNAAVKDRHNAPAAAKAIVSNSHIPSTLHSPTASAPRPPPQNRPPPQPRPPALPKPPKPPRDGPVHMHRKGITCYACVAQREERAAAKLRPPPLPFSQPPIADITVHTPQGVQREPQLQLPFNAEQPQIPDANSIIEAHTTPLEGKIEQDPPSSLFSDYTVDPSLPHPAPSHDIDQDNAAFASQQSPDHSIADSPIPHIDGTPLNIPFAMQVPPNGAASAPAVSLPAAALYNTPSKQALAASRDAGPSSPAPSSWPQPTVRSPYKWHNARPDTTLPASLHEWRGVLEQEGISTFESLRHISPHFVDRYVKDLSIKYPNGPLSTFTQRFALQYALKKEISEGYAGLQGGHTAAANGGLF